MSRAFALVFIAGITLGASWAPAQDPPPPTQPPVAATQRQDSVIVPAEDQARGVDAEIRAALFQLMNGDPVPALSRLQWLASSPTALGTGSDAATLRRREDLLFLLAEAYYTLGMDEAFRAAARQVVGGAAPVTQRAGAATPAADAPQVSGGRYGAILRTQLMLDSYRRGDYAGAITLSRAIGDEPRARGLASLVSGLAYYQLGQYPDARTAFAAASTSGAPYDGYARYMDALTQLRTDTANAAPALAALQSLASSVQGEFADQVRLTAAQLAYEMEQYPVAIQLAGSISNTGGLAAQGLFTRAWSLYKSNQVAPAGEAFLQFATQYPELPEREESRLMHAQALLQLGQTDQAATIFRSVADSAAIATTTLQAKSRAAMTDAARALVRMRAAGLLFIRDPASGKTLALADAAGAELAVLAAVFADSVTAMPGAAAPDIVSLADVNARLSAVGPAIDTAVPRRLIFAPTSATRNPGNFSLASQGLYEADVGVALARNRLNEQLEAQRLQLALLRRFQQILENDVKGFDTLATRLQAAHDSLTRVSEALAAAGTRLTQMFMAQVSALRLLAEENRTAIDSLRRGLAGAIAPIDQTVLDMELETARYYRGVADAVESGLAGAIRRHPVFALGDSVNQRSQRASALLAEARGAASEALRLLGEAIADAENMESDRVRALRAQLSAAEGALTGAETRLVALVDAELRARAGEMVALLRRDTEAAEFGSASALFFQALDAERAPGSIGTSGTSTVARPPVVPPGPIKPRK